MRWPARAFSRRSPARAVALASLAATLAGAPATALAATPSPNPTPGPGGGEISQFPRPGVHAYVASPGIPNSPPAGCGTGTHPQFLTYCAYATHFDPAPGSDAVQISVPDKCAKWASWGDSQAIAYNNANSQFTCPSTGYPLNPAASTSRTCPDGNPCLDPQAASNPYKVWVSDPSTGHSLELPVEEAGPWNISDNWWDPANPGFARPRRTFNGVNPSNPPDPPLAQGEAEAHAAYYNNYNTVQNCTQLDGQTPYSPPMTEGADYGGRCVLNPAGVDLSTQAGTDLGEPGSAWVTVSFEWEPSNVPRVYVVDENGGVHAEGVAGSSAVEDYFGFDIARGLALGPSGNSGWVLDGYGGIHAFYPQGTPQPEGDPVNDGQSMPTRWGWDIGRAIALIPGSADQGYILDGYGGLHGFGPQLAGSVCKCPPAVTESDYWGPNTSHGGASGWDIARGLAINPVGSDGCVSGYVLDGYGGLHPFVQSTPGTSGPCTAPALPQMPYYPLGQSQQCPACGIDIAKDVVTTSAGVGFVLDGYGGVHPWAQTPQQLPPQPQMSDYWGCYCNPQTDRNAPENWDIARGLSSLTANGGYVLDGYGGLHLFWLPNASPPPAIPLIPADYWQGRDIARGVSVAAGS